jgi:redox-sensitive bicupin YhaK (pirin superfamily)
MGFGALRVLNDDTIQPQTGFGMHPHKDMEIITIVTEGAVTHTDDVGTKGAVVKAGDVQIMSAGTGVTHAEQNDSKDTTLKLFQLWITPKSLNIPPRYGQVTFPEGKPNFVQELVSPIGSGRKLTINQDAVISRVQLEQGSTVEYKIKIDGNGVYIFVIEGSVEVGGETLNARDALGVSDITNISLVGVTPASVLLIEVPMA